MSRRQCWSTAKRSRQKIGLEKGVLRPLVAQPQVAFDDPRSEASSRLGPARETSPVFEDVAVVGHLQGGAGVLLDEQDGDISGLRNSAMIRKISLMMRGRQAEARLVEHEQSLVWP